MWVELGIAAAIAALASACVCAMLVRLGPLDHPHVPRKRHSVPTPTSGGLGIAAGFVASFLVLFILFPDWERALLAHGIPLKAALVLFALIFLFLGFLDDAMHLSPRLKLLVFSGAALVAAWRVGVVNSIPFGEGQFLQLPLFVALIGTGLWIFTLVNCMNFMDGSNGLAMGSAAIALAALGGIALQLGSPSGGAICFSAVGALVGFLLWNFPKGRLFAGDSGALFVGAIAALTSLYVIRRTQLSPLVPPILFFPILSDSLLTLLWRVNRGRPLLDGHVEHLYQIAHRASLSHTSVALVYWLAMALCAAIGWWAARVPHTSAPLIALALLSLISIAISAVARSFAISRGIAES